MSLIQGLLSTYTQAFRTKCTVYRSVLIEMFHNYFLGNSKETGDDSGRCGDDVSVGSLVIARWKNNRWYPATVIGLKNGR